MITVCTAGAQLVGAEVRQQRRRAPRRDVISGGGGGAPWATATATSSSATGESWAAPAIKPRDTSNRPGKILRERPTT